MTEASGLGPCGKHVRRCESHLMMDHKHLAHTSVQFNTYFHSERIVPGQIR